MKFVYPEFLWAFGVLLIPVIIHLFNFRKYKVLYFSSLKFLQFVDQKTRSTQKLKHLLVLLSRILAFSFLIFGFAQPYIPAAKDKSTGGKPVIAIYIDNSFSMSMKGTEGELISEAREMARKIITEASLETRFMLVTNALSGIEQRLVTKLEALERLDKIEVNSMVRNIGDVLEWEKKAIQHDHETKQKIGVKQFIVFSDFQKNSSDLRKLQADTEAFYYPIKLTPLETSTIFVDSVWFTSPVQKVGESNELNVRVGNHGKDDLTNVQLHLEVGAIKRDVFIDILANNKTVTVINYTEQNEGFKQGKVSVNDKQFFYDDEYFFSYNITKKSNILLINGENSTNGISLVYSLDNFYSVEEIPQNSFTNDLLSEKDLVIINGAKEIPSGLADDLEEYSKEGGSLALFPGEDVLPSSGWNSFLISLKMPTLGKVFMEGVKIKEINFEDAFFKSVFEKNPEHLNLPTIAKSYRTNAFRTSQSIGLIYLQNGSPLYIRSLGSFNVFLYTSSLSPTYGSFTSNALFSTILLRTAELSKRKTPLSLIIGTDSRFPIYSKAKSESPIHLKNKDVDFIPQTEEKGSITYLSLNGLEALEILKSGTYSIMDESSRGIVSLNYNRKESEIEAFENNEIISLFEAQGVKNITLSEISEGQSLTKIDLEKPYEYWKTCIILALLFILIEMALLKFWKK